MQPAAEIFPPPDSADLEGWRRAVHAGDYTRYRLEHIVAAIQDLGPDTDKDVLNSLAGHLSHVLFRILRRRVSAAHRNKGRDIIEQTHARIIEAVLQPATADGRALRVAFVPRVAFRIKNALASEAQAVRTLRYEQGSDHGIARKSLPAAIDPIGVLGERLDIETLLATVEYDQKRLAFRLFMDGIPYASDNVPSISTLLRISETTARKWIKTTRELLASTPAIQDLNETRNANRGTDSFTAPM